MAKLTPGFIKGLKSTDKHRRFSDGDGLSIVVRPNGSKAWQVRIGKADKGIGSYPEVGIAEARRKASAKRKAASQGREIVEEATPKAPTFAQVAEMYLTANAPTWRHPKTETNMRARLQAHAYPAFGQRPVDTIRRADVMDVLETVWTSKPGLARKLKQGLHRVFVYALARDWIAVTPVDAAVAQALPKTPATRAHFRSLPYQELGSALGKVEESTAGQSVKLCFRWLVLTASRSGEARNARWEHIDLKGRMWTIPGDMMKSGREHRVPISIQAADVLKEAAALGDSGLVFPGFNGPLSDMTLTKLLRSNGLAGQATIHGFRTSFKTWCMETTATPWAIGEAALAHNIGNSTKQAYARSDLFELRRALMQQWADFTGLSQ